jgi:hypothetical protein
MGAILMFCSSDETSEKLLVSALKRLKLVSDGSFVTLVHVE